jgi:hypothetical protein
MVSALRISMFPSAPSGSTAPRSSVMRAVTVGSRGPTQPGTARSIQLGAQLAMPPVSVDPYPVDVDIDRCGKRTAIRRMMSGVVADPPTPIPRICEVGTRSMSGLSKRRAMWVVPPLQNATFSRSVRSTTREGSKRPKGQTVLAPVITVETAVPIPETWKSGKGDSRTDGGAPPRVTPAMTMLRS